MSFRERVNALTDRLAHSRWSPLRTIVGFRTEEPLVALTFDDGPDPDYTAPLLGVLEHFDAEATFFMVGRSAERHPEIVRRVADGGHAIGNHTHTHPSLPSLDSRRRRAEIRRCADALAPFATRLFRPPKGHQTVGSRVDVLRCGHEVVGWGVDAEDWEPHSPGSIAARVEEGIAPGAIVLLHDGLQDPSGPAAADRSRVVEAVERVLEACSSRYEFVSIPSLMERAEPIREGWFRTSDRGSPG